MDTTSIITLAASVLALGASVAALVLAIRGKRKAGGAEVTAAQAFSTAEVAKGIGVANEGRIAKLEEASGQKPKKGQPKRTFPEDADLSPILAQASEEDLDPLVGYILEKGKFLGVKTENLSKNPLYIVHNPNHREYIELIEKEIRTFGGHTWFNPLRREGAPAYREVVIDVAKDVKVEFDKESPVADIEMAVLVKILGKAFEKMSETEKFEFIKNFGIYDTDKDGFVLPKQIPLAVLQAAIKRSGFAQYRIAAILVNAFSKAFLKRGLSFGANAAFMKGLGYANTITAVITTLWTLWDIGGKALRVTRPCVAHIAYLRLKYTPITCQKCSATYLPEEGVCPTCGENN
jgi:uncharacterized protein YaaW (UPF0174 family)